MNVYDFDKTIFAGDSTVRFYRYCLRRFGAVWLSLPGTLAAGLSYALGLTDLERFKGRFYRFLRRVPDVERAVEDFWEGHWHDLRPWYLEQRREDDLVISASPDFLIGAACRRLGIRSLASPVDARTGALLGPNCKGEEKVRRFRALCGDAAIDEFYSDSHSDDPLAALARNAWLVRGERRFPWNTEQRSDTP